MYTGPGTSRDERLRRDVAIKVLHSCAHNPKRAGLSSAKRPRLLASLNHPNIGSVYEFEQQEGSCAPVLELIEGQTLLDRIRLQ